MQGDLNGSSKAGVGAVVLLFGVTLLAGAAVGALTSLIGRVIYLIFLFPVLMGMAVGYFIKKFIARGKIRAVYVPIAAAVFAAMVTYLTMHFVDYLQFRYQVAKNIQAAVLEKYGETAPDSEVQNYIDTLILEDTGAPGFLGFVLIEAREGVSISHVGYGSSESGLNLGIFTWLYWLAEMGIIGWYAAKDGLMQSREPFCEHCDTWVAPPQHIGGMKLQNFEASMELLKKRDFQGIIDLMEINAPLPTAEFYTRTCETCSNFPFYISALICSKGNKGQIQTQLVLSEQLNMSERFALKTAVETPRLK